MVLIVLLTSSLVVPVQGQSQASNLPAEDEEVYPGYYWGAAGIVDVLIKLLNSSVLDENNREQVLEMIDHAIEGIWDVRITDPNGKVLTSWHKFNNTEIYPGKKYGAAGIVQTLISLYDLTGNTTYLEMSNDAIYELYAEAKHFDLPHWPYSYYFHRSAIGIYITDQNFGSMGIIDSTLDLYSKTKDPKLLEWAINATLWVESISYNVTVNGETGKVLPWYQNTQGVNNTLTSYGWGNSGAIPVLLKLAKHSNDTRWRDWAEFITKWIIDQQRADGSFPENSASTHGVSELGFETGVTGVLYTLHRANSILHLDSVNNAVSAGLDWLKSQFIDNSTYQIFPVYSNSQNAKYSLFQGMSGINMLLRELDPNSPVLDKSVNWILNEALYTYPNQSSTLLGMYQSTARENYVDLSMTYGLSGVVLELLRTHVQGTSNINVDIFDHYLQTLEVNQLDSGLWPRQIELSFFQRAQVDFPVQLLVIFSLMILAIVVFLYRKRRLQVQ